MTGESIGFDEVPLPLVALQGGTIVAATASATALLTPPGRDVVGVDLLDLITPDSRPEVDELMTELAALGGGGRSPTPGEPPLERRLVTRLGPSPGQAVELRVTVPSGAAGDRLLVGLVDQHQVRRLSAVIDAVADSTLLLDPDGRLVWQSEALSERVPRGSESLGSHPVERIHPEDLPLVLESFAELAGNPEGRVSRVVRSRAVDNDDLWQLIELIGAGRADHPDLGGVVVQVRNLDEGAELESVAQTEGPLLSLAEAAPVGILLMDKLERVTFASGRARGLLGFGETDDLTGWRDLMKATHRQALDGLVADGLRGAEPVTITVPVGLTDGRTPWLRVRIAPHLGTQRQVVGVIAALEDVTAEVEARIASERLLHMLDATSDFVAIFRPSGEVLHTNAALQQVLDQLAAEGGSGRMGNLLGDEARDRFIENALSAVAQADTWQGELDIQVGGDRVMPVSALAVVHWDDEGELDWIAMVARDISEQKEAEAGLRRVATLDHLTGLANRALFTEHLERVVARSAQSGRAVAMLFCDLDRFKEVNDRLGHAAGDAVLVAIANRLREITRGGDMAARVGGDEFVILCEGVTDVEALAALAERVIESVGRPIDALGDSVQVGISIGVAVDPSGGVDGDRLLIIADQAMYRAKATGGNRYRIQELGAG